MTQDIWQPGHFRDAEIWIRLSPSGQMVRDARGLVEFRYQPGGKSYHTHADRLVPNMDGLPVAMTAELPAAALSRSDSPPRTVIPAAPKSASPKSVAPAGAIEIWTDGACSGNPGPAGLGVHVRDGGQVRELSEYLGVATNNIAELMAIQRGLEMMADPHAAIAVMTDSEYSLGLLTKNWKPKKNQELVADLRAVAARFTRLTFVKVAGHAGIPGNERADELARRAIETRQTSRTVSGN